MKRIPERKLKDMYGNKPESLRMMTTRTYYTNRIHKKNLVRLAKKEQVAQIENWWTPTMILDVTDYYALTPQITNVVVDNLKQISLVRFMDILLSIQKDDNHYLPNLLMGERLVIKRTKTINVPRVIRHDMYYYTANMKGIITGMIFIGDHGYTLITKEKRPTVMMRKEFCFNVCRERLALTPRPKTYYANIIAEETNNID